MYTSLAQNTEGGGFPRATQSNLAIPLRPTLAAEGRTVNTGSAEIIVMVTTLDKKIITDGYNGCIRLNTLVTLDIISFKCSDGFITNVPKGDIDLSLHIMKRTTLVIIPLQTDKSWMTPKFTFQ